MRPGLAPCFREGLLGTLAQEPPQSSGDMHFSGLVTPLQHGGAEGHLCVWEETQGGSPDLSTRQEGKRLGGAASTWALLQALSIAALCLLVRGIVFETSSDLVTSHWLPKPAIEDSSLIKPQPPFAVCPPAAFTLPSHSAVAQRVFLLGTGMCQITS